MKDIKRLIDKTWKLTLVPLTGLFMLLAASCAPGYYTYSSPDTGYFSYEAPHHHGHYYHGKKHKKEFKKYKKHHKKHHKHHHDD